MVFIVFVGMVWVGLGCGSVGVDGKKKKKKVVNINKQWRREAITIFLGLVP